MLSTIFVVSMFQKNFLTLIYLYNLEKWVACQRLSIRVNPLRKVTKVFFASRRISTIRARFEFWRSNAHPVLFHRLGRRIPYAAFGGARVHVVPFYSRIVISTASTACKTCKPSFSNKKKHLATDFLLVYFFQELSERPIYIYIVAIGAGPLSLQSKVLLTVLLAKLMILLRKKSGKYPIISRVLYIPRWLAGFLPSTVVHDDTTTATTATTTTTSSHV